MNSCDKDNIARFDYSQLSRSLSGIPKPAQRALISNGVLSTDDLAKLRRSDIAGLHGVGPSVLKKLDEILHEHGLEFKA